MNPHNPHNGPKTQSLAWYVLRYKNPINQVSPSLMECFALTGRTSYATKLPPEELEKFGLEYCRALKINGYLGRAIWVEGGDFKKIIDLARAHGVDFAMAYSGYVDLRAEKTGVITPEASR